MFSLLKYLPLVTLFQDVTNKVKESGIENRPWYLQRSVIGAIIALLAGGITAYFGFSFDSASLDKLASSVTEMVTAGTTVYGLVLSLYGLLMKVIKAKQPEINK
jgi:hypothetical protein